MSITVTVKEIKAKRLSVFQDMNTKGVLAFLGVADIGIFGSQTRNGTTYFLFRY